MSHTQTHMAFDSDFGAQKVWVTNNRALWFLVWCNLLILPKFCPRDHQWSFGTNEDGGYHYLVCKEKLADVFCEDEGGEEIPKKGSKRCGRKQSWRIQGTLPHYLPDAVTPAKYVKALYWFSSDATRAQLQKEVGLKDKTLAKVLKHFRDILWLSTTKRITGEKLGGPGHFVAVDDTFFVKKKAAKGGFRGRATAGNKTIVMGFLEVNLETRKASGRCVLIEIPDRKAQTLKQKIKQYVQEGSLIFTDKLKSYQWLSGKNSSFVHRCVNHSRGEFARTETLFGKEVRVTTNAVEGLFGRLKKYFRQRGLGRVGKNAYGHLLAEFLFRQMCSAEKTEVFPSFLHEILDWQAEHPQKKVFESKIQDLMPDEIKADFDMLNDESKLHTREIPKGLDLDKGMPEETDRMPEHPLEPPASQNPQIERSDSSDCEIVGVTFARKRARGVKAESLLSCSLSKVKAEIAPAPACVKKEEASPCVQTRKGGKVDCCQASLLSALFVKGSVARETRVNARVVPNGIPTSCGFCATQGSFPMEYRLHVLFVPRRPHGLRVGWGGGVGRDNYKRCSCVEECDTLWLF